jgi:putative ABC transport system permease protein
MRRFRWFGRRDRDGRPRVTDGTFDDEVEFHLDARAAELQALGQPPDAAWAQAEREFGDAEGARRYVATLDAGTRRQQMRRLTMTGLGQDVRYAVRRLRRAPAFTVAVILTFALGIGANSAIFSVVNGVLLRPLPFPEPERLYAVYSANRTANIFHGSVSPVDLDDWRARRQQIADLGGYLFSDGSTGVDLTGRGDPRRLSAVFVTAGFFNALAVRPEAGRLPREHELVRGGPDRVVVLTDGYWGREFGRDPTIIGGTLALNGEPYSVIGVLPPSMQYPTEGADVYVPYSTIPDSGIPRLRVVRLLSVVARARPGVTADQVAAEMSAITAGLGKAYPDDEAWDHATVEPLVDTVVAPVRDGLWVLFGAVGFVLAMACVNVASLQLARATSGARDLAISAALGAARSRLVRQLLTEGLFLALGGGTVGLGLASLGVSLFLTLSAGQLPRATGVQVDRAVVLFAAVATLLAGLVSTLLPALQVTGRQTPSALRDAGRGVAGAEHPRLRASLVVVEVAFAMLLAIGAGLMGRSFAALLRVDPGFKPDHLIAAVFTIDEARHGDAPVGSVVGGTPGAPSGAYYTQVIERVRALPGVVSAAAVKDAPFRGTGERVGFTIPTQPIPAGQDPPTARLMHISDGYFATIGTRILNGREFTPGDRATSPLVAVVNEAFARQFFPGAQVVGQRLTVGARRSLEIVGLVGDIHQISLALPVIPTLYLDNLQNTRVKTTVVARTLGAPALLAPALRGAIWSVDAAQPIADVFTFDEAVSDSLATPRLLLVLLTAFGVLGAALGVVGIYGLLASMVSRRRTEIGVRMALGASATAVTRLIVSRGATLASAGIILGGAGAFLLTRFLASVLFGVAPFDPLTIGSTAAALFLAAVLASWLPARRAAATDPARVLRAS